ncbi:MAG: ABC transporter ATP-binding protein [Firmicutes bacterium]|nr:ABC transporter ATP-binding protein [Bacillota bacterium]
MASISVQHVSKRFLLRKDRADSVGQLLIRMVPRRNRRPAKESFWALRDISLDMPEGVSYGIIGSNGSGKSTLLKILTRTMAPTEGIIHVEGRVSALIELGAGFHPDFTGRENVYLNASILGIPRRDIEKKMEDIIEFAEIRPFIDTPVKYYSSGMNARLGFAVATSVEPEILIVDEVLAVGDEAFQQRCMDRIFRMKRQGTSILLVSHDLGSIERLMDRALWINKGVMQIEGAPRDVVHAYRESLLGSGSSRESGEEAPAETGILELARASIRPGNGRGETLTSGDEALVEVEIQNHSGATMPGNLTVRIRRPDGLEIATLSTFQDNRELRLQPGMNRIGLMLQQVPLMTGQYELDVAFHVPEGRLVKEWSGADHFQVQAFERQGGLLVLPHQWQVKS